MARRMRRQTSSKPGKSSSRKRVRAVGEGLVGVGVDFEEQGVAAGGDRGAGQGGDHLALAR